MSLQVMMPTRFVLYELFLNCELSHAEICYFWKSNLNGTNLKWKLWSTNPRNIVGNDFYEKYVKDLLLS